MRNAALVIGLLLLGGCQAIPAKDATQPGAAAQIVPGSAEARGLKLARNRCSDCHAVERWQDSPRPAAPSFERIANTPGLTKDTLAPWLREVHNFPQEMYFEIPAEHIDDLVAYMLTLKRSDYRPPL